MDFLLGLRSPRCECSATASLRFTALMPRRTSPRVPRWVLVLVMVSAHASAQSTSVDTTTSSNPADAQPLELIHLDRPVPAPLKADEPPIKLDGVVVKGEKLGRSLKNTTTSVNVTNDTQLEAYGDESISDTLKRAANTSTDGAGNFSLRGISNFGAEGYSRGAQLISVYVDGVVLDPTALGGAATDTFDIEQIEVLRGAQSTSQGRNALGGAIVETTREPTDYWDARVRTRYANAGSRQLAAAGGGPFGDGFSFRVTGDFSQDDGDVTNVTLDDPDWAQAKDRLLRFKLAYKPPEWTRFTTLITASQGNRSGGISYFFEPDDHRTERRQEGDNVPDDETTRSRLLSWRNTYAITPKLDVTATTGFVLTDAQRQQDYDQTAEDGGYYQYPQSGRNLTQEIRFNLKPWRDFSGLFGLYAGSFANGSDYRFYDLKIPLSAVLPVPGAQNVTAQVDGESISQSRAHNLAAFTEFDYHWNTRLTFTAGLRYDNEASKLSSLYTINRADSYVTTAPNAPSVSLLPVLVAAGVIPSTGGLQVASGRYDALLPKLGARYALTSALAVFATYTQAYRAGGADVNNSTGTINPYKPEYTYTYETGANWSPRERLNFRLNAYYTRWVDQQVLVPTPDGLAFITQNAARSRLFGGELETRWKPINRLELYVSLGYSRTRFVDYFVPSNSSSPLGPLAIGPFAPVDNSTNFTGHDFVQAPKFTASTGGIWKLPYGFFGAASFSYATRYFSTPQNRQNERGSERELLDARFGWKSEHFEIYGYGRNLLDQDYDTYRFTRTPGFGTPAGQSVTYGALRRIGLQLEAKL